MLVIVASCLDADLGQIGLLVYLVHPVFVWVDPVSTIGRRLFKEKEAE